MEKTTMKKTIVMIFAIGILFAMAMPMLTSIQTVDVTSARAKPDKPGKPDKPTDPEPDPEPTTGDGVVRKWALVIGISDYASDANDLTYCDDDAMDWKNYLQGEGYTVDLLLDHQASADNIYDAYLTLAANEDGDDMVAFCYSGHGYYYQSIRESCLVSSDEYLLPASEFKSIAFESQHVFMFLDCCNAGTFSKNVGAGWVAGIGSATRTYTYDGTPEMGNGIYTYYAMEAIGLGYTTAEDICDYAKTMFNAATPGRASTYDQFTGDMDI
jgi:hypothetical protein